MRFKIVNSSSEDRLFPEEGALKEIESIATSAAAALHLAKQFWKIVEGTDLAESGQLVYEKMLARARFIEWSEQQQQDLPWTDAFDDNKSTGSQFDFDDFQRYVAETALQDFMEDKSGNKETVFMDYAVNDDDSDMLRGFADRQGDLGAVDVANMDAMLSSWLAEHGYIIDEGKVYERDDDGHIKQSDNGESIRADSKELKSLLSSDKEDSFSQFAKKISNGRLDIDMSAQKYPAKIKQTQEKRAEKTEKVKPQKEKTADVSKTPSDDNSSQTTPSGGGQSSH